MCASPVIVGGIQLMTEFYHAVVNPVHNWCMSKSYFGNFDVHHRRHEMAVHILKELKMYEAAVVF